MRESSLGLLVFGVLVGFFLPLACFPLPVFAGFVVVHFLLFAWLLGVCVGGTLGPRHVGHAYSKRDCCRSEKKSRSKCSKSMRLTVKFVQKISPQRNLEGGNRS
jgi:hypothetical protein